MYPPRTSNRRKERFERFCRLLESITSVLSVGPMGSSPARLTINYSRHDHLRERSFRHWRPSRARMKTICRLQERRAKTFDHIIDQCAANLKTLRVVVGRCQNE